MNEVHGSMPRPDPDEAPLCTPGGFAPSDLDETDRPEPDYLRETYTWAYLNPRHIELLDRWIVVAAILWGNADRLTRVAAEEFSPGQTILQPAAVYGPFSKTLAARLRPGGHLEVRDVAPAQVSHTRRKLAGLSGISVNQGNAADPVGMAVDGVCCFFLLHEVPDDWKRRIMTSLLDAVPVGGKIVFVDYHKPAIWHPLRLFMYGIFHWLEPYALGLMDKEIMDFTDQADAFRWTKRTFFGGLYQKVVAERIK